MNNGKSDYSIRLGMKFDTMKYQTPYPLCASATLREVNHPAIMQRLNFQFPIPHSQLQTPN
jgi:hypothetical protein